METSFEQKVRERAYEIWQAAGMQDGMAHEHWCAAETDVRTMAEPTTKARAAAPRRAKTKVAATATSKAAPRKSGRTLGRGKAAVEAHLN